jgi:O-antigen ligase
LVVAVITFAQAGVGARVLFFNETLYRLGEVVPNREALSLNVNALGSVVGTALPGLLAYVVYEKRVRPRAIAGSLAAVTSFLLVMSASSSGLFAAAVGVCFLLLLWKPWTLAIVAAMTLAGLYWVVSVYHPASQWAFLLPIDSLVKRFEIWGNTLTLLSDRWVIGLGLGGFLETYNQTIGTLAVHTHNEYLQLYGDAGLLGGAFVAAGGVMYAKSGWRVVKEGGYPALAQASLVSLAAFAANGIFEVIGVGTAIIQGTAQAVTSYHYVAVPYVWAILAMLVIGLRNSKVR